MFVSMAKQMSAEYVIWYHVFVVIFFTRTVILPVRVVCGRVVWDASREKIIIIRRRISPYEGQTASKRGVIPVGDCPLASVQTRLIAAEENFMLKGE
jgi:hypothetical protein